MMMLIRMIIHDYDDDDYNDNYDDADLPNVVKERSLLCGRGELVGNGFLQTYNIG